MAEGSAEAMKGLGHRTRRDTRGERGYDGSISRGYDGAFCAGVAELLGVGVTELGRG